MKKRIYFRKFSARFKYITFVFFSVNYTIISLKNINIFYRIFIKSTCLDNDVYIRPVYRIGNNVVTNSLITVSYADKALVILYNIL